MSKKETDILLIRKYLNGELDARAMHQLERRAQSDPFLMDAIEGYENAGKDQQSQLDDLNSRLQQRIERKERRIIPWRTLAIAASVLIVLSVGGLLLFNSKKPVLNQTAVVIPPVAHPKSAEPTIPPLEKNKEGSAAATPPQKKQVEKISKANTIAYAAPVIAADQIASADVATKETDKVAKDTTPLNEMVVMGYATQKKKNVTASVTTIKEDSIDKQLNGKVAGVAVSKSLQETRISSFSNNLIKGKVVDKNDGAPLPGVTVKIAGSNTGTQTDANGYFNLPADSTKNTSLLFGYIGYQSLRVDANNRDSLKTIKLQPSSSSLSEVVTSANGIRRNNDNAEVISAHPAEGWDSFKKYLKENAISPDGKTGVVKLSFVVDRSGGISEIKVIKGLSPLTDRKAIELINDSPDWTGSTSSQPETVKIKVKFAKK